MNFTFIDNSVRIINNHSNNRYGGSDYYEEDDEPEYYLPPPRRRRAIPSPRQVAELRAARDDQQRPSRSMSLQRRGYSEEERLVARLIEATGADCSIQDAIDDPELFQELVFEASRQNR